MLNLLSSWENGLLSRFFRVHIDSDQGLEQQTQELHKTLLEIADLVNDLHSYYPLLYDKFHQVYTTISENDDLLSEYTPAQLFKNEKIFKKTDISSAIFNLIFEIEKHIMDVPLLSDGDKTTITPNLVSMNPQAAIQSAFAIFEDHLRKRIGVDSSEHGQNLINKAYGKNGILTYGETEAEKQGIRDLIAGMYATFRNPRMHRIVKDHYQVAESIILQVGLVIQLIDESEDVTRNI